MIGHIHSIESFGTVDGPGIRLTVFFKGCPMRCLYCHNPDTWDMSGGTDMTAEEILDEYEKGAVFYKNGGITATGGEPLMQIEFLTELFTKAKKRGIHTCLDTSGILFSRDRLDEFDALTDACDLVMLDIKHIDDEEHRKLTGHSNKRVLDYLDYLAGKNKAVWIRHVIVPGITLDDAYLARLGGYIGKYRNIKALDVLPYHSMAKPKYSELGMEYPLGDTPDATKDEAVHARNIIIENMKKTRKQG
ncbi:MAG: pyruvate formate lyase-activating protein [Firmicutes bacterium]|nr:pyruvate formate lyase-activating protein [Bacillota bacterium]